MSQHALSDTPPVPLGTPSACLAGDADFGKPNCWIVRGTDIIATLDAPAALVRSAYAGVPLGLNGDLVITDSKVLTRSSALFRAEYQHSMENLRAQLSAAPLYIPTFSAGWGWFQPDSDRARHLEIRFRPAGLTGESRHTKIASYLPGFEIYDLKACVGHVTEYRGSLLVRRKFGCDGRQQILVSTEKPGIYLECDAPGIQDGRRREALGCLLSNSFAVQSNGSRTYSIRYRYALESTWIKSGRWQMADALIQAWLMSLTNSKAR